MSPRTAAILESIVQFVFKNAKNTFTIPGFGKLVVDQSQGLYGPQSRDCETIRMAAKRVVKFRIAKVAKDAILGTK